LLSSQFAVESPQKRDGDIFRRTDCPEWGGRRTRSSGPTPSLSPSRRSVAHALRASRGHRAYAPDARAGQCLDLTQWSRSSPAASEQSKTRISLSFRAVTHVPVRPYL
jgi:hypothetical protein